MKKGEIIVRKLILVLALMSVAYVVYAGTSLSLTTDSRTTTVSTLLGSPTQILTLQPFSNRTYIINNSTIPVIISTFTKVMSSTTDMVIPGSATFSPDGVNYPYGGPMFAAFTSTATAPGNSLTIFRSKQ